jgi:hypothetical protein
MSKENCPMGKEILAASKRGRFSEEMRKHLSACSDCSDSLLVARWMGSFRELLHQPETVSPDLPDMEEIWQRARDANIELKRKEKKALRPLLIPRILSYLAALAGVIFLLTADLSGIKHFIAKSLGGEQIINFFTSFFPRFINSSIFVAIPFFIILLSMAGYFFYSLINPERN